MSSRQPPSQTADSIRGIYSGLATNGQSSDSGGLLQVKLGANSRFSGTLKLWQQRFSFRGEIDANGRASTSGTVYHFRLVANSTAGPAYGDDKMFIASSTPKDLVFLVADSVPRPITHNLLAGFSSPNARVTDLTHPTVGDFFTGLGGRLLYLPRIPFRTFRGSDSFEYTVDDGNGGTVFRTVTFINPFFRARGRSPE